MPVFQFGSGVLFGTPQTGDLAANPTPMQFGTLQNVSLEIGYDVKELYGRNQFPEDVAKSKGKISGKASFARMNGKLVNDLFFGQTLTVGQIKVSLDEISSVPTTPFTVTVTNAANFREDLGVRYAANQKPFVRVATTPAQGQYSVNTTTGVYTFNTADQGTNNVLISYTYNVAASGSTAAITNQLMGFGPRFSCILQEQYATQQSNVKLYACVSTKFSRATKVDDYLVPEFDFSCFADAAGKVIDFYDAE